MNEDSDEVTDPVGRPYERDVAARIADHLQLGLGTGVRRRGRDLLFSFRDAKNRVSSVQVSPEGRVIEASIHGVHLPGPVVTDGLERQLTGHALARGYVKETAERGRITSW